MVSPDPVVCPPTPVGTAVQSRRRITVEDPSYDARHFRQFRRVADAIVKEFPSTTGGIVTFSGMGSASHVADVAMQVAQQLARQPGTVVTLVDGDAESQLLTQRMAVGGDGLAEVLQHQKLTSSVLAPTSVDSLRFVPFGDGRNARNPITPDTVKKTLAELRHAGDYTVVAAGTGTSKLHAMLSRYSDGTYLVVQLGAASRQDTSELADYLARAGARLLGCVATSAI